MGYLKNKQIEYQERGYSSIDSIICTSCVGDHAIKSFIRNIGTKNKCDYCSKIRKCCKLEDLIGHIVESIRFEFEDATGCMHWEGKEGGFIGARTYDNYNMVFDKLSPEMGIEDEAVLTDIYKTLNDSIEWCDKDPYALRIHEEDYIEWKQFCKSAKSPTSSFEDIALKSQILYKITEHFQELGLIKNINKDTGFYRSVIHDKAENVDSAKRIGSAPVKYAAANRMSRKGVSMFYGAEDIETTLKEIGAKPSDTVTSAKFYPSERIKVLDLTQLDSIEFPSLFDPTKRHLRSPLIFMRNFATDVSKKCNGKPIQYLPTQIFTEHIRNFYKEFKLSGIIYNSSLVKGKKCCVLFFNNEHCIECNSNLKNALYMDKASLKNIN
ncbi:HEPN-associated N-terminal domain-containing protein [Lacrimispora amygdalina]|uniref:HEPN-associated N-terminal domain-containing protein n=1 Tax=Lacrimispora amygdalina TaxID=253257 RepID=UPI000BE34D0E|nr:HEPN-associated N-terminal domain-containing protein [Lacrimispora amygdalina]